MLGRPALAAVAGALAWAVAIPAEADPAALGAQLGRLGPAVMGRAARASAIRRFAARWIGTPYRWGGAGRGGIDCSAYLRRLYRELFGVELPRTTRQQIRLGVDVPISARQLADKLEPGDVVFYVDRTGTPNHVVVFAGGGRITHSVSGRGVVVEPIRKLYGRRVIARRFLIPAGGRGSAPVDDRYGPIPAAGPLTVTEIACPDEFRPRRRELRHWSKSALADLEPFADRELCDVRVLAAALAARPEPIARQNAAKLETYAEWLESLEALNGVLSEP